MSSRKTALPIAAAVLGISLETLVNQIDTRFHGRESDKTRNASSDGRRAGQELCSSIKPFRKKHYVQAGVGHYGVFSGNKWATQIYPVVRNMILAND